MAEPVKDVSLEDFLAHRRPMPHLFDLAPHTDPVAFQSQGTGADRAGLNATVRSQGEPQTDVRLLIDDGERYLALATELANSLYCDVYLTPHGAHLRYVREFSPVTNDSWDVIAVERQTGEPAEWLVVRPSDLPEDVPTWFVTARGRLRQSNGLVKVLLPDGVAFATKATFQDISSLAARMKVGASRVTTVAVNADLARFEITRFDDAGNLLGGVEFATLVGASLDVVHPDVQLALTWPTDTAACEALDVELMRLADALNRTIWVPEPAGAAFVIPGCGEFAAVDEVGGPSTWRAYPSRLATDWRPHYGTDLDGRLVPMGAVAAARFPGVRLVSMNASQLEQMRRWYESVAPCDGLFVIDLAVLGDGRFGVQIRDKKALAVGARELRMLLREAGWSGEDLLLLAQPPAKHWDAALAHVRHLVDLLAVDIWLPAAESDVWVNPDGTLAADGPNGAWHVVAYGRSAEGGLPHALANASRPTGRSMRREIGLELDASSILAPTVLVPEMRAPAVYGTEMAGTAEVIVPAGLALAPVLGTDAPHAVHWLPPAPVVNSRPIDLYIWTPMAADVIEGWGLPSADLFLLAGRDPLRLADRRRDGYLLRVLAPERTAVDLHEHGRDAPATVRQRLVDTGCTHLLPLAWMSDLRVTARFDLDAQGGISARSDLGAGALAIRFEGAEHGVPGLPNEVVHWPDKGQRADAPMYLMLSDVDLLDSRILQRGYVSLSRKRPAFDSDRQVLELKVRKRRAIDVPATLNTLSGLPVVGRLHDFVGLDLLLSEHDLANAVLAKIWRHGPSGKPVAERLDGETLSEALGTTALQHDGRGSNLA